MNIDSSRNNTEKQKDSIGKITGFFLFRNLIDNYNSEKNSLDEQRNQVKKYGVLSIILAVVSIGISLSCLISTFADVQLFGFSYVVRLLIYILGGVVICLIMAIYSFVFAVMQVRLNRKAVGIFGIVFSVLSVVSSLLLIVLVIF